MNNNTTITALQQELTLLYRVAQHLNTLEIDELLAEIVIIASEVTSADSCFIYVVDQEKKGLVLRASKNPHKTQLRSIKMQLGEGITGWVAREQKAVALSSGASEDPRFKYFSSLPEDRFEAFLSVPIVNKTGVVGVINIQHKKPRTYGNQEIRLLTGIGKLVGGAIENALLIEETLALKDALEFRKTLDRAKGILMKQKHLTEQEAYSFLRSESMKERKSIKELAEAILLVERLR
ncbi:GAF domain-containing protein [Candidatus Roizmanbacteria bacterium]|nr:GAF domain-containing protein [Candidatus Roizmanbacteria bacterium]